MILLITSPETRKAKPVVPQPKSGSSPQTPRSVLRTEGGNIGEGPIQTFPLSDMEKTPGDFIMPPEKIGPPVLYPSLAEMTQEENRTPSSDAPLTGEPTIFHRIGGPSACDLCWTVDPTHLSVTCWQKKIEKLGAKNWELGVSPLTPPFNRHPILSLIRSDDDIFEELFVSTVPQPTKCSIPQTPGVVLGTEDPLACHLCGSADPKHPSLTCWERRINELGTTNWEIGVIPPSTPPLNRRPILSLRRRSGEILEELFASPPLTYRQFALTQKAYDDFITPPNPIVQTQEQ